MASGGTQRKKKKAKIHAVSHNFCKLFKIRKMSVPEPPLYADLLQLILILALVYLVAYSIHFRHFLRGDEKRTELPLIANSKHPEQKIHGCEFYIEPSPISHEAVVYPVLPSVELDLSVVILAKDIEESITKTLESLTSYLSMRENFTYEVIVVDMNSRDSTRSVSLSFADSHNQVRILHIPFNCSRTFAITTAFTRTRGQQLFLYDTDCQIPINAFSEFERKLSNGLREDRDVIVIGSPSDTLSDHAVPVSALCSALTSINQWLLSWLTKERQCVNCGTFLFTRSAAVTLAMTIHDQAYSFDSQMLIIAWKNSMSLKTVRLTSYKMQKQNSQELLDDTAAILKSFFMYTANLWPVKSE